MEKWNKERAQQKSGERKNENKAKKRQRRKKTANKQQTKKRPNNPDGQTNYPWIITNKFDNKQ